VTQHAKEPEGAYRLERFDVVVRGRGRELARSVIFFVLLLVIQQPLREEALKTPGSTPHLAPVVSLRISLVIDLAFMISYVLVTYRAWGLVRVYRAPPKLARITRGIAYYVVPALLIVDVAEDLHLWTAYSGDDRVTSLSWGPTHVILMFGLGAALVVDGLLVVLTNPRVYWRREAGRVSAKLNVSPPVPGWLCTADEIDLWKDALVSHPPDSSCHCGGTDAEGPRTSADRDWGIVCCSGGGLRSAAFSLGGLQALNAHDLYGRASAVVGVSGGGYTSTAFHVMRWQSGDTSEEKVDHDRIWTLPTNRAFTQQSPELQWLRRHTHYVLDSVRVAIQGAFTLAFGIAVNLVLLAVALGATAWLLAWVYLASGTLTLPTYHVDKVTDTTSRIHVDAGGDWWLLQHVWWVPLAGVFLFLLERAWDRFHTVPHGARIRLRAWSTWLVLSGAVLALLLVGLPALIGALYDYADTSGTAYAKLIYSLGVVPQQHCQAILNAPGATAACGVKVTASTGTSGVGAASIVTIVASILAVLASLKGAGKDSSDATGVGGFLKKIWAKIKDPVIPWLAVSLIVVVCLVQLVRWTALLATRPGLLDDWTTVRYAAIALVLLKVFTDPNRTSLHHFFRERIAYAFLVRRRFGQIDPLPYREPLRFSRSRPKPGHGPRLVTCAVANASDATLIPTQRGCTPFVFDDAAIGLTDRMLPSEAARRGSATYEFAADYGYRDATVPAAVAMSAAAFSPLAGRENVRLGPYRAVLALANARLGVWLPNPLWVDTVSTAVRQGKLRDPDFAKTWGQLTCEEAREVWRKLGRRAQPWIRKVCADADLDGMRRHSGLWASTPANDPKGRWWVRPIEVGRTIVKKPGLTRVVREAVGQASIYDRFLYVTDGGHYDNLGLIEALRREPRRIFVIDASNDAEDTFRALGLAVATARMDLDCELRIDPSHMKRLADKRAAAAWCTGTATFADGTTCEIYLVKAIMIDGAPWDVETYAASNLDFPRTSTGRQLYSEFDFEAYRMLGVQAVDKLLASPEYSASEAKIATLTASEATKARIRAWRIFEHQVGALFANIGAVSAAEARFLFLRVHRAQSTLMTALQRESDLVQVASEARTAAWAARNGGGIVLAHESAYVEPGGPDGRSD
jgi:hypothetical protein